MTTATEAVLLGFKKQIDDILASKVGRTPSCGAYLHHDIVWCISSSRSTGLMPRDGLPSGIELGPGRVGYLSQVGSRWAWVQVARMCHLAIARRRVRVVASLLCLQSGDTS